MRTDRERELELQVAVEEHLNQMTLMARELVDYMEERAPKYIDSPEARDVCLAILSRAILEVDERFGRRSKKED